MFQEASDSPSENEQLGNHMSKPNLRFDLEADVHFPFELRLHKSPVVGELGPAIETACFERLRDCLQ